MSPVLAPLGHADNSVFLAPYYGGCSGPLSRRLRANARIRLARASIQLKHWRTMDRWQNGRSGFRFRPGPDILPLPQGSNPQPTWPGCPNC